MNVVVLPTLPSTALEGLSATSRQCIQRLKDYHAANPLADLSAHPTSKLAGVLVLLFERDEQLHVLLTTRSKSLRTHSGQTALPGGRVDPTDANIVETALREAHEEVKLPLSSPHVHPICLLDPFVSAHHLIVTPVVALLSDVSLLDTLEANADEVAHIFTHPLHPILDPSEVQSRSLVPKGSEDWPWTEEYHRYTDEALSAFPGLQGLFYRYHRFRSSASPVSGLTADVLIKVASIAYAEAPHYERNPPGQPKDFSDLAFHSLTVAARARNGISTRVNNPYIVNDSLASGQSTPACSRSSPNVNEQASS
ncbi:NUDIX hydrolase domain-like protein [Schizophyllum commune]